MCENEGVCNGIHALNYSAFPAWLKCVPVLLKNLLLFLFIGIVEVFIIYYSIIYCMLSSSIVCVTDWWHLLYY